LNELTFIRMEISTRYRRHAP